MKKALSISLCLILLLGCEDAPGPPRYNPETVRNEADRLEKEGRYDEALERRIWYHNNILQYDKSERGVRLSFALGDWVDLAEQFPPAMEALTTVRDEAARRALKGRRWRQPNKQQLQDARDVISIDKSLGRPTDSLPFLTKLYKASPEKTVELWNYALRKVQISAAFGQNRDAIEAFEEWAEERGIQ